MMTMRRCTEVEDIGAANGFVAVMRDRKIARETNGGTIFSGPQNGGAKKTRAKGANYHCDRCMLGARSSSTSCWQSDAATSTLQHSPDLPAVIPFVRCRTLPASPLVAAAVLFVVVAVAVDIVIVVVVVAIRSTCPPRW